MINEIQSLSIKTSNKQSTMVRRQIPETLPNLQEIFDQRVPKQHHEQSQIAKVITS